MNYNRRKREPMRDEYGNLSYNTELDGYLRELGRARDYLLMDKDSFDNNDLIEIANAIKMVKRGIDNNADFAKDASSYLQKCLPLSEYMGQGYAKIFIQAPKIKRVFENLNNEIVKENFFYLLTSPKINKNRTVVFRNYNTEEIKVILDSYETLLNTIQYIKDNKVELLKHWIGWAGKMTETKLDAVYRDEDGNPESLMILTYDKELQEFSGRRYELSGSAYEKNLFEPHMSDIEIHISAYDDYEEVKEWLHKFFPEYLI